ncbi:3 (2)5 -bisphosphate nucleotidase [Fusarium albosuccineum]|uniref:3 (2)5 -bisphosphate nucleotidase n=1 Tax=Fusarium albosuccineum TaxID=1237068 RepID=A0A8H4PFW1_9HYPO|nr:3 (2)5 -bisphosphate nucleotidase [Fusarium albosuccineum]
MTVSHTRERHLAELAVLRASILTKQVQSTVREISKDDNSPVTVADFAAQALLIGAIRAAFPNDAVLGEEDSAVLRADQALSNKVYELVSSATDVAGFHAKGCALPKPASVEEMLDLIDLGGRGRGGDEGRFWVMDPIDGTAAFLKGQQYAVSLALIEDGKEVVGVLGCPNISAEMTRVSEQNVDQNSLGIMLTAVRGRGSTIRTMTQRGLEDAVPLSILKPFRSKSLHIVDCATSTATRHDVVAKLADDFKTMFPNTEIWSSHIRYAALIVGGGDVQFWVPTSQPSKMCIWDHAGSQLIFTELGGNVTDLDGKGVDFGAGRDLNRNRGLVVARGGIHPTVLETMNKILEEDELGGSVCKLEIQATL